jgi:M6 family metalloprotease-like protein
VQEFFKTIVKPGWHVLHFYEKIQEEFKMRRVLFFAVISCLFPVSAFCAPYMGKEFEFHQPDGSPIAVRLWGDEFYVRVETLDGYSLVNDPVTGFICYAEINNDESDFISTGIPYTGRTMENLKSSGFWPSAKGSGIKKGLRLKRQAVIEKADRNRQLLGRDRDGRILPAPDSKAFSAASAEAGAPAPLIGNVIGLTLLIEFPDVPATIPQADIDNYCNQVGYTGYGNNGSVRDYYYDVSNGNLTYTNYVTVYYTALHNRSYYTDPNISYGTRARELIKEALVWLDDPAGQNFNFGTVSTDSGSYMLAINAFYAGPTANNWAQGLWPHMSSMYGEFTSNEGAKSGVYQISNIGSSLVLGTFCHENGHMICGYPDLYDYGYESYGAGNYCLMAYGGSSYNPVPPNPYLRDLKGWETVTLLPHLTGVQYFLQSNTNNSCKYLNPDNSHEFFYIDSRTKTGRNASLPDDGLAIWHIDENGSNDYEQMTPSQHYKVSVEQADGLFHLEHDNNPGGSGDFFHAGYKDIFNNTTVPDSKWWNGNNSNLVVRQISAVGSTMSFVYDYGAIPLPPVAVPGSASTPVNTPVTITLVAADDGLPNPPAALTYIITSLPSHGVLSDPGNGIIDSNNYSLVSFGNQVVYTPDTGYRGTDSFQFKANDGGTSPQGGDSNAAAVSISTIDVIYMANMDTDPCWSATGQWQWGVPTGQGGSSHGNPDPASGYTGSKVYGVNLSGDYSTTAGGPYYLTTRAINCSGFQNIHLKFHRWLNSDYKPYVTETVEVSKNGSTWVSVWNNGTTEITDSSWQPVDYDINSIADNEPNVYVRWGHSVTSGAFAYSGWNIDDMNITGEVINYVDMEELAILGSYWHMTDCNQTQPCSQADWFTDGTIDMLDLQQLGISWLGPKMIYGSPEIKDGFETGNFSALPWVLTGNANWTIVSTGTYEGAYSAKSGAITDSQAANLEVTIDTADANSISFARKVSSESGWDYLMFYIDGVLKNSWSGTADWAIVSFTFTPGSHTFKWTYIKDGSISVGSDCAWIDNVRIYKP